MVIPDEDVENSTDLRLPSSVVTVGEDNTGETLAINLNDHAKTKSTKKNKQVTVFQVFSPQEGKELFEFGPKVLALDKTENREVFREKIQILTT